MENLRVRFPSRTGFTEAVRGVSFTVGREKLGIVGESGSGKSMTGRAILRLVAPPGEVTADRIDFDGTDLLNASERKMREIRGQRISMVMQDPKFSLNPVMTVGRQIAEAYRVHTKASRSEARAPRAGNASRRCASAIPSGSSTSTRTRFPAAWASAS